MLDGKRLKVWASLIGNNYYPEKLDGEITQIYKEGIGVKVSNGEIIITQLQLEGKKRMDATAFVNGVGKEKLIGNVLT